MLRWDPSESPLSWDVAGGIEHQYDRVMGEGTTAEVPSAGVDEARLAGRIDEIASLAGVLNVTNARLTAVMAETLEDGSWSGTHKGTFDSAAVKETTLGQYELTGEGAYAGLSVLLYDTSNDWPTWAVAGAIFPGPLPPDSVYGE